MSHLLSQGHHWHLRPSPKKTFTNQFQQTLAQRTAEHKRVELELATGERGLRRLRSLTHTRFDQRTNAGNTLRSSSKHPDLTFNDFGDRHLQERQQLAKLPMPPCWDPGTVSGARSGEAGYFSRVRERILEAKPPKIAGARLGMNSTTGLSTITPWRDFVEAGGSTAVLSDAGREELRYETRNVHQSPHRKVQFSGPNGGLLELGVPPIAAVRSLSDMAFGIYL